MNFTNFFSFLLYPGAQNSDNLNCRGGRGGDGDGGGPNLHLLLLYVLANRPLWPPSIQLLRCILLVACNSEL
jgi:hypothetical protein